MNINNSKFSTFSYFQAPIYNNVPSKEVTLEEVYSYIISDEAKERTEKLRSIKNASEARMYKMRKFDNVTFSGRFGWRSDSWLIGHSGLMCFDFDGVEDITWLKRQLLEDPFFETQLLFTSPSGNGVKWVISVDLNRYDHRDMFVAISNYLESTYNIRPDAKCINESRTCFLPYDPDCYINPCLLITKNNLIHETGI